MLSSKLLLLLAIALTPASAQPIDAFCNVVYVLPDGGQLGDNPVPTSSDLTVAAAAATPSGTSAAGSSPTDGGQYGDNPTPTPSDLAVAAAAASSSSTSAAGSAPTDAAVPGNGTSGITSAAALSAGTGVVSPVLANGTLLQAPQPTNPVPSNAAIYVSPYGSQFNLTDFHVWITEQRKNNQPSKWLKVTPGEYTYLVVDPGDNGHTNIAFGFYTGGWTLDLRGCTFTYSLAYDNYQAIYINQSEDLTILGGTFWIDPGEIWSQARVISMEPVSPGADDQNVVLQVEQGYNVSIWETANARNLWAIDDSNPNHYTRPACNFWYMHFPITVSPDGTIKAVMGLDRGHLKVGYVLAIQLINNVGTTVASEYNGGLTIDGMTTNG